MATLRPPAVAGLFYPDHPDRLHQQIDSYLNSGTAESNPLPKAVIAPHAGYIYSGPVAASAYRRLAAGRTAFRRVVLLGPSHRVAFRGIAVSQASAFTTPLGDVTVDHVTAKTLLDLPYVSYRDDAHADEHSLEVQLPFLQCILDEFSLIPLVVGECEPEQVGTVLERLWGGPETLIVISSDLSHFHDYDTACRRDSTTSRAIEQLDYSAIGYGDACGRNPVNGLLWLAQRREMTVRTVDLRNSGDTAGGRDRVVGYGSYLFHD